jgi:adenylate cyclase class IV
LNQEIEIKIGLKSEKDFVRLCKKLVDKPIEYRHQETIFFKIPSGILRARHESIEYPVHPTEVQTVITFKHVGTNDKDVFIREEYEAVVDLTLDEIKEDPNQLLQLPIEPIYYLQIRCPSVDSLSIVGDLDKCIMVNKRYVWPFPKDEFLEMEVDQIIFPGEPDQYEIEIELMRDGEVQNTLKILRNVLEQWGVHTIEQPMSKFERFRDFIARDAH